MEYEAGISPVVNIFKQKHDDHLTKTLQGRFLSCQMNGEDHFLRILELQRTFLE